MKEPNYLQNLGGVLFEFDGRLFSVKDSITFFWVFESYFVHCHFECFKSHLIFFFRISHTHTHKNTNTNTHTKTHTHRHQKRFRQKFIESFFEKKSSMDQSFCVNEKTTRKSENANMFVERINYNEHRRARKRK